MDSEVIQHMGYMVGKVLSIWVEVSTWVLPLPNEFVPCARVVELLSRMGYEMAKFLFFDIGGFGIHSSAAVRMLGVWSCKGFFLAGWALVSGLPLVTERIGQSSTPVSAQRGMV
jgi:hypothetical protein